MKMREYFIFVTLVLFCTMCSQSKIESKSNQVLNEIIKDTLSKFYILKFEIDHDSTEWSKYVLDTKQGYFIF